MKRKKNNHFVLVLVLSLNWKVFEINFYDFFFATLSARYIDFFIIILCQSGFQDPHPQ